ncbi:MAG: hypoxanthine phosphoribosyltransferase [Firmicutes bacterium]|nr:hypoxanthine phosphoribosyltransferase [Bacillota bacterium]
MLNDIKEVLFSEEEISERCKELASEIEACYKETGATPLVLALLKGSIPFMAELIKRFTIPVELEFMSVSSYSGVASTGDVKINKDMDVSCRGRSILLVEDIIDTGRTIKQVVQLLYDRGAEDVKIVALLDKKEGRVVECEADYVGFDIPNAFVVGYGLDYNQKYRNLPFVGVLKEEVYS